MLNPIKIFQKKLKRKRQVAKIKAGGFSAIRRKRTALRVATRQGQAHIRALKRKIERAQTPELAKRYESELKKAEKKLRADRKMQKALGKKNEK